MTTRTRVLTGLWSVLYLFLIGLTLNHVRPYKGDESFYLTSAIAMHQNGNLLVPEYFGAERFQKPILPYWLTLSGFQVFGISLWSGRLAFLLMAGLLLVVVYRFALLLLPDERFASLAVILFSSSTLFLEFARVAMADLPLTFFVTLGLYNLHRGVSKTPCRPRPFRYAYLAMGFAFASKGFLALFPLGAVLLYLLIGRPPGRRRILSQLVHPLNLILFLLPALSWYVFAYWAHRPELLAQFRQESSLAITSHLRGCLENLLSHAKDLLIYYFPFVAWGGYLAWRRRIKPPANFALVLWYLAVALFTLVILVQRHKARYLLVVFPALTLLLAYVIHATGHRRAAIRVAVIVALLQVSLYLAYPSVIGSPLRELTAYWRNHLSGGLTTHGLSERERGWVLAYSRGELMDESPAAPFIILREDDRGKLEDHAVLRRARRVIRFRCEDGALVREYRDYLLVRREGSQKEVWP